MGETAIDDAPFQQGDIVYGDVRDEFGDHAGFHPLVVLSSEEFEQVGYKYYVVLVTSQVTKFKSELKHHRMIHRGRIDRRTKFDRENFADCECVYSIWHDDIVKSKGGKVHDDDLRAIIKLVGPPPHRRRSRPKRSG